MTVWIVLNKKELQHNNVIADCEIEHKTKADNAELSIAEMINDEVLVKVFGITKQDVIDRGIKYSQLYDEKDAVARKAYYFKNKPLDIQNK